MGGFMFLAAWLGLIILVPTYTTLSYKRGQKRKDDLVFKTVEEFRDELG